MVVAESATVEILAVYLCGTHASGDVRAKQQHLMRLLCQQGGRPLLRYQRQQPRWMSHLPLPPTANHDPSGLAIAMHSSVAAHKPPPTLVQRAAAPLRPLVSALDSATLIHRIQSYGAKQQWQQVLHVLDEAHAADAGPIDPVVVQEALTALGTSGMWKPAVAVVAHMREAGEQPTAACFAITMKVCTEHGQGERALQLFESMKMQGPVPNEGCYDAALAAAAEVRQWQTALNLLQEFSTAFNRQPSQLQLNTALMACSRAGKWQEAVQLLQSFPARSVSPGFNSYSAVIQACGLNGQYDVMQAVLLQAQQSHPDSEQLFQLYQTALKACSNNIKAMQQVLVAMQLQGMLLTTPVYEILLGGCEQCKQWQQSIDYLQQMKANSVPISSKAYHHVLHTVSAATQYALADKIRAEMTTLGYRVRPVTALKKTTSPLLSMTSTDQLDAQTIRQIELVQRIRKLSARKQYDDIIKCLDHAAVSGLTLNIKHFNAALSSLAVAGQWQQALHVFTAMTKQHTDIKPEVTTFQSVIQACAVKGRWKEALSIFNTMRDYGLEPNRKCYNALIDACGKGHQSHRAIALLREMRQLESELDWQLDPNTHSYKNVMRACNWQTAMELLTEMKLMSLNVDIDCYMAVVRACIKAKQWDTGISVLHEMFSTGIAPSAGIYTELLRASKEQLLWDKSVILLDDAIARGIQPTLTMYTLAMKACSTAQQTEPVLSMYKQMQTAGIQPKAATLNTVLHAYAVLGDWQSAMTVYNDMITAGLQLTEQTYHSVMSACYKGEQWQNILDMYSDLTKQGVKLVTKGTYKCVLAATAQIHGWRAAFQLFIELRATGIPSTTATYMELLHQCQQDDNNWEAALHIVNDTSGLPIAEQSHIHASTLTVLCKAQQWQHVIDQFEKMRKNGLIPTRTAYRRLLHACSELDEFHFAHHAIQDMKASGIRPTPLCYDRVLQTAGAGGHWQEAISFINQMIADDIQPTNISYDCVIRACGKAYQWSAAVDCLRDMYAVHGVKPDQRNYKAVILSCAICGQWQEASELYRDMLQPDNNFVNDIGTHIAVIDACSQAHEWQSAVQLLDETESLGLQKTLETYNCAIRACAYGQQWQLAIKLIDDMQADGIQPDITTYCAKLSAYGRSGMCDEALQVLDEIRSLSIQPNSHAYAYAISSCVTVGNMDHAHILFKEMKQLELDTVFGEAAMLKGFSTRPTSADVRQTNAIKIILDAGRKRDYDAIINELARTRSDSVLADLPLLDAAIIAFQRSGKIDTILQLYTDAVQAIQQQQQSGNDSADDDDIGHSVTALSQSAYCAVISACGEHGAMWQKAVAILNSMHTHDVIPSTRAYEATIHACCKGTEPTGGYKVAIELLQQLTEATTTTLQNSSDNYDNGNDDADTSDVSTREIAATATPTVSMYATVMAACSRNKQWQKALDLFNQMNTVVTHIKPDARCFTTAIAASNRCRDWSQSLTLFDQYMADTATIPTASLYNYAMAACNKHDDGSSSGVNWQRSLQLFYDMPHKQLERNATSYGCAIHACAIGKQWQQALQLLRDMPAVGLEPDVINYNAAMLACREAGEWQQAVKLLDVIEQHHGLTPTAATYDIAITACKRADQRTLVAELQHRQRRVVKPTDSSSRM
jgi:pentatricopeptide repeat protein